MWNMFRPNWRLSLTLFAIVLTMPIWVPVVFMIVAYTFVFGLVAVGFLSLATMNMVVWTARLLGVPV